MTPPAKRSGIEDLVSCHDCGFVVTLARGEHHAVAHCPRCRAAVHRRKPDSLNRTWALVITAAMLYVPANLFPVMTVISLGKAQSDTILSGAVYLLVHGMWPLALIVVFASVVVPMLKLIALAFLLISVQQGSRWRPVERTRLYHIVEAVGRWSMTDIYVVTILVALVSLGNLASIEAGVGAIYFAGVVVTTMLAAESFDPRLIWDRICDRAREPNA
jgi:paraquat-inducible protein A